LWIEKGELLRAIRGYEELPWYGSSKGLETDFLAHTMALNDVMVAVTVASWQHEGYTLETWRTEREIKTDYDRVTITESSGRRVHTAVVPDSYFALLVGHRRYPCFLELDRGTMALKRFRDKVKAYLAYIDSGGYERRYGSRKVRILTVTLGEKRAAHLKSVTEEAGGVGGFGSRHFLRSLLGVFLTFPSGR